MSPAAGPVLLQSRPRGLERLPRLAVCLVTGVGADLRWVRLLQLCMYKCMHGYMHDEA